MPSRSFYAGICNDRLFLYIAKGGKVIAEKIVREAGITDGALNEPRITAAAVLSFLSENNFKPRFIKLFIKTSKMMSRLRNVPRMNKRELESYQKHNIKDFFPVSTEGMCLGAAAVYESSAEIILYAAAVPQDLLDGYIKLFSGINIKIRRIHTFQELALRAALKRGADSEGKTSENKAAAVFENSGKISIIFFENGVPVGMRDMAFEESAFVKDFDGVLKHSSMDDAREFYLFGEMFEKYGSYFTQKGAVHNENEVLSMITDALSGDTALSFFPEWYDNKLKINKALKISTACMAALFLIFVMIYALGVYAKQNAYKNIYNLAVELESDKYTLSEEAIAAVSDMGAAFSEHNYDTVSAHDILLAVFSCLPPDARLSGASMEADKGEIVLYGTAKTDEDLLDLIMRISDAFSSAELVDVQKENAAYTFVVSFSYRASE